MSLDPFDILKRAQREIPAVKYLWGVIAAAACVAVVYGLLSGHTHISIIMGSALVLGGAVLWLILSSLHMGSRHVQLAASVLVWLVMAVLVVFMVFTISAVAAGIPCNWASLLGLRSACETQSPTDPVSSQSGLSVSDCPQIPPLSQTSTGSVPPGANPDLYVWVPADFKLTTSGEFERIDGHWQRKQRGGGSDYVPGHWIVVDQRCVWVTGEFARVSE